MSSAADEFARLIEIMATLRGPEGCPWDREQTIATLRPYVLEETYEVLEAVDRRESLLGGHAAEIAEVGLAEAQPVAVARPEPVPDSGDGRPIGVETEEAAIRVGRHQDPRGVAPAADGGVDLEAAGRGREHAHDLVGQHRKVPLRHRSSTVSCGCRGAAPGVAV